MSLTFIVEYTCNMLIECPCIVLEISFLVSFEPVLRLIYNF